MAEALMSVILEAGIAAPEDINVGEPVEGRRAQLAGKYGVDVSAGNLDAVNGSGMVVLSVKPQTLGTVMDELRTELSAGQVVLSIVAGARMATLVDGLDHPAIIRVMPNTPAQIGAGMTVWTASQEVSEATADFSNSVVESTIPMSISPAKSRL